MIIPSDTYTIQDLREYLDGLTITASVEVQELTTLLLDITANTMGAVAIGAAVTMVEVIVDAYSQDFGSMNSTQRAEWAIKINKKLEKEALPRMLLAGLFGILSTIAPWFIAIYAAITGVKVMNESITLLIKVLKKQHNNALAKTLADALYTMQSAMNYVLNSYATAFSKYVRNAKRQVKKVTTAVITKSAAIITQMWSDMVTKPMKATQMSIHQVIAQGPPNASKELIKLLGLSAAIGTLGIGAVVTTIGVATAGASGTAAAGGAVVAEGVIAGAPIVIGSGTTIAAGSGVTAAGAGGSALLLTNPLGWTALAAGGVGWLGWRNHQNSIVMLPINFN